MASFLDVFTNKNAQDAADSQKAGLQQGFNVAAPDLTAGIGAIQQGYGTATGALNQGAGAAGTALQNGYNAASPALTSNYTAALQPFLKNYGTAQGGVQALTDALGITGDPSQVMARLQQTPGYQFQLNQGSENVLRNASRTGTLASGGTNVDLTNYGQGLAGQTYNNYVNSLMPFLGQSNTAASGIANTYTGLGQGQANLATGLGQGQANIATGLGTGQANLATGQGGALNNAYGNLAQLGWNTNVGQGNAQANADLANNQASANMWGAILQGGKLAMGGAGGGAVGAVGGAIGNAMIPSFTPSDARLKEDIEPIGKLYDGANVYRYRYKGDHVPRIGLMAQEIERTHPEAVADIGGGFKGVDYRVATDYASKLSRFLEAA